LAVPNPQGDILKITGIHPEEQYEVKVRKQILSYPQKETSVNQDLKDFDAGEAASQNILDSLITMSETEEYQIYGDMLMNAGIKLSQQFAGIGIHEQTRVMGDFATRLYVVKEISSR
jgi:hypothetical protein